MSAEKNLRSTWSLRGSLMEKRDLGRKRQGYVVSMERRLRLPRTNNAIIHSTKDRELWGTMIFNVVRHDI